MGKLTGFLDIVDSLTGRSKRHNRTLRDVTDLSRIIQEFFSKYHLQEKKSDFDPLFENIGSAKVELTTIAYQTRTIIKSAKNIKGKKISPLLEEVHSDLGEVRRALIKSTSSNMVLDKHVPKLHKSFKKLLNEISDIEYK